MIKKKNKQHIAKNIFFRIKSSKAKIDIFTKARYLRGNIKLELEFYDHDYYYYYYLKKMEIFVIDFFS